jgi:hypothetical protein
MAVRRGDGGREGVMGGGGGGGVKQERGIRVEGAGLAGKTR